MNTWLFRGWNNQLVCFLLDTGNCLKMLLFYLWHSHILVCALRYKTTSFNCCCTKRSPFFMLSFYIHEIKNRLRIYVSLTGVKQSKTMKKTICENQCQIFLFLPKKLHLQKYSFIMTNLRPASRRINLKNVEQILAKNVQSQKEKNKMLK